MTVTLARLPMERPWVAWLALGAASADVAVTAAVVTGWPLSEVDGSPSTLAAWAAALVLAVAVLTAAACRRRHAGWFHPLSLPLVTVAVMSLGAPLWVYLTGSPAGLIFDPGREPGGASLLAAAMSVRAVAGLALVAAGYLAGAVAALALAPRPAPLAGCGPGFRYGDMRRAGLALMAAGAGAQSAAAFLGRSTAYGTGQLSYGAASVLGPAAATALLAGLAVVTAAASRAGRPAGLRDLLRGREQAALCVYAAAVAVSGQRAGLIAPAVFLAWAYSTQVRPVAFRWVASGAVLALVAGAVIAGYRHDGSLSPGTPATIAAGAAGDVSSPAWLTQQTVTAVPYPAPYLHGSTYLAALEGQLPGPLSRRLGAPTRTASAVFRGLIGFYDPDQGFAESYPSEAYLNFGLPGCLGAGVFLGALMGWAWRRRRDPASRARDLLYPVLLAGLAYGFRSDALTQVKDVLYPLLVVWAVMSWYRLPSVQRAPERQLATRNA